MIRQRKQMAMKKNGGKIAMKSTRCVVPSRANDCHKGGAI
jgi:hypothetical protein